MPDCKKLNQIKNNKNILKMKFTFAISCIAALSVAQVSDEVIEAWKAQNEAWEYMLEA